MTCGSRFLVAAAVIVLSPFAAAGELDVPPYLQLDPDGGMTVMWNTIKPAHSWIEHGDLQRPP